MPLRCARPARRCAASGVDVDLRRDQPYSGYENFKFNVPISTVGDVYARYLVRVAELRESQKIAMQALEGMPEGPSRRMRPRSCCPTARR